MSTGSSAISKKPAETPAQRRRRRVRDDIIEAAERVFLSEGPSGLSIRRLAEEIDYSPSAIYKYFASKTELVDCLKDAFFERLIEKLDAVIQEPGREPNGLTRECIVSYIQTGLEKPHHYVAAFSGTDELMPEADAKAELFDDMLGTSRMRAFEMLLEQIQLGIDSTLFRPELHPVMAAKSLWASMHGLTLLMIHLPGFCEAFPEQEQVTPEAFLAFHADMLVRGLEV